MPTKPTQERMVEILATKVMGWTIKVRPCRNGMLFSTEDFSRTRTWWPGCVSDSHNWNPFTDLNVIHTIEKRLNSHQWNNYERYLGRREFRFIRHAEPAVCAEALARVVAPEEFQNE